MKNTYEFYFNNGVFTCRYDNNRRVRVLKDSDALMMLHRVDRFKFTSFKVSEKETNNRRRLYLHMNSNNNRVLITNFKKFYEYDLFDEMPRHLDDIEKACIKFSKKKLKPKSEIVKKLVATATALALITGGVSFSLNKDKSVENNNVSIEQEYNDYENSNNIQLSETLIETMDTISEEMIEKDYSFDNKLDSSTYKYVEENYSDLVDRVGKERGISKELLLGMVTQESSGKDPNLMQITYSVWKDHVFNAYNFDTNSYEKMVISDNPSGYKSSVKVISSSDMSDPYNNITIGSLILRDALETYDYNIPIAIQAYNFGYGNMSKVFDAYTGDTGISKKSIINDTDNIDFTNYTNVVVGQGDSEYLNHVMRYVDSDEITVKRIDNDNIIDINFRVNNKTKDKTK